MELAAGNSVSECIMDRREQVNAGMHFCYESNQKELYRS